jgi:PBP1b-binding outer membrane lipoprotein LpoB
LHPFPKFEKRLKAMVRTRLILLISGSAMLLFSCSNMRNKQLMSDAPKKTEFSSDGRVKNESNMEKRKRVEYFNGVQHK